MTTGALAWYSATAGFLSELAWPVVIVALLRSPITGFISGLKEIKVIAGGVEASAVRGQIEAAAALGAAAGKQSEQADGNDVDPSEIADAIEMAVPSVDILERLDGAKVLWVDDLPDNNRFERQAMNALGIQFSISPSTEVAINMLRVGRYDLVISDMSRPPDSRAGYTLLDQLRSAGNEIPFVIYAGSASGKQVEEAKLRGALTSTNSPQKLMRTVTQAIASA